jgi:hypothetical protein
MYRAGSLRAVGEKISKYKLDSGNSSYIKIAVSSVLGK